jgi:hypothetical protein
MCPLPPAHMSLIRKDSWTLTFFVFIQFLHLLFLWQNNKHFLTMMCSARNKERIIFSLFLLVLIISISTHLFIHLANQKKEKKEIMQNIYRYIVKTFVHGATVIQIQCKTKSKMDLFGHFVMICMHIKF